MLTTHSLALALAAQVNLMDNLACDEADPMDTADALSVAVDLAAAVREPDGDAAVVLLANLDMAVEGDENGASATGVWIVA